MNKKIWLATVSFAAVCAMAFAGIGIKNNMRNSKLKAQFAQAEQSQAGGNLIEARDAYKGLMQQNFDVEKAKEVYGKIEKLNVDILFSPVKTEDSVIYKVQPGDTLDAIAKKYGTTVQLIKRANNLTSSMIKPGAELKVNTAKFSIVVDKSQNILTLKANEQAIKTYNVATGTNNCTPVGIFKIATKIIDPPWYSSGRIIPSDDPKNILGSRWMGFTIKSYGIHGTTDDSSIGTQQTQGCVRMHNSDVEEFYDIIPVGTEVTILD